MRSQANATRRRRLSLEGSAQRSWIVLGRSLCRGSEWAQDELARWKYEHAPLAAAAKSDAGLSGHVVLAVAVGAASIALELAAGGASGIAIAAGTEAATLGIATRAIAAVTRRLGVDEGRSRAVLGATIAHIEAQSLCSEYAAEAWRIASRLPRGATRERAAGRALLRDGAKAALAVAVALSLAKVGLKKAPWISTAIRLSRLPYAALDSARLVCAAEAHAAMLCRRPEEAPLRVSRFRVGVGVGEKRAA